MHKYVNALEENQYTLESDKLKYNWVILPLVVQFPVFDLPELISPDRQLIIDIKD